MKLSTKGRYAVMAMVDLARHAQAKPVSLSDIATRQEISLSYLEQLFARLRRAGLVKSVRGPGGGYRLTRGSADTRVSEIILAVDEPIKATRSVDPAARRPTAAMDGRGVAAGAQCLDHGVERRRAQRAVGVVVEVRERGHCSRS